MKLLPVEKELAKLRIEIKEKGKEIVQLQIDMLKMTEDEKAVANINLKNLNNQLEKLEETKEQFEDEICAASFPDTYEWRMNNNIAFCISFGIIKLCDMAIGIAKLFEFVSEEKKNQ